MWTNNEKRYNLSCVEIQWNVKFSTWNMSNFQSHLIHSEIRINVTIARSFFQTEWHTANYVNKLFLAHCIRLVFSAALPFKLIMRVNWKQFTMRLRCESNPVNISHFRKLLFYTRAKFRYTEYMALFVDAWYINWTYNPELKTSRYVPRCDKM